jgi:hypothetical protein
MLTLVGIKSSINKLLIDKFAYPIYGREVQEGFKRPSFFVEILPSNSNLETQNFNSNKLIVIITYFQEMQQGKIYSDLDNIKMYDSLRSLFSAGLRVLDRHLTPQNIRSDYADTNKDILQFSFDLNYFDTTGWVINTEPTATDVVMGLKES